jgi:hypothetical protein
MRHWLDATLLEASGRPANADQLFGFAAECGLKLALAAIGPQQMTGEIEKTYWSHIDRLWAMIPLQGLQKRFSALAALLRASNPFHDWSVNHRYTDGTLTKPEILARHKKAAARILGATGLSGMRGGAA